MRVQVAQWEGFESLDRRLFSIEAYATPDAFVRSDMLRWLSETVAGNLPSDWTKHGFADGLQESFRPFPEYLRRRAADLSKRIHRRTTRLESPPLREIFLEDDNVSSDFDPHECSSEDEDEDFGEVFKPDCHGCLSIVLDN